MLAFHTDQDTLNRRLEVQVGQSQVVVAMFLLLLLYVLVTIVVVIITIIIIIITIVIMALNDTRQQRGGDPDFFQLTQQVRNCHSNALSTRACCF